MIFPEWQGRRIDLVKRVHREMEDLDLDILDVLAVLEFGYDCQRAKRKKGTVEKCLRKNSKVIRVVAKEGEFVYPDGYVEEVWWLIHASIETFKPERLRT